MSDAPEAAESESDAGAPGGPGAGEDVPSWRVKVYRLNEDGQWDDCGTGSVALARGSAPTILVLSEAERCGARDTLLASRLVPSHDAYSKQGENIITWDTRRGDGGSVRSPDGPFPRAPSWFFSPSLPSSRLSLRARGFLRGFSPVDRARA